MSRYKNCLGSVIGELVASNFHTKFIGARILLVNWAVVVFELISLESTYQAEVAEVHRLSKQTNHISLGDLIATGLNLPY